VVVGFTRQRKGKIYCQPQGREQGKIESVKRGKEGAPRMPVEQLKGREKESSKGV